MTASKKRLRTAASKEQETFLKRKRGLEKKAHELSSFTSTEVHLVMFRDNRYYTYSSTMREHWPPSHAELVSMTSNVPPARLTFKANNHPPTKRKGPADFKPIPFPARLKRTELSRDGKSLQVDPNHMKPNHKSEDRVFSHHTLNADAKNPIKQAPTRFASVDQRDRDFQPQISHATGVGKSVCDHAQASQVTVPAKGKDNTLDAEKRGYQAEGHTGECSVTRPKRRCLVIPKLPRLFRA